MCTNPRIVGSFCWCLLQCWQPKVPVCNLNPKHPDWRYSSHTSCALHHETQPFEQPEKSYYLNVSSRRFVRRPLILIVGNSRLTEQCVYRLDNATCLSNYSRYRCGRQLELGQSGYLGHRRSWLGNCLRYVLSSCWSGWLKRFTASKLASQRCDLYGSQFDGNSLVPNPPTNWSTHQLGLRHRNVLRPHHGPQEYSNRTPTITNTRSLFQLWVVIRKKDHTITRHSTNRVLKRPLLSHYQTSRNKTLMTRTASPLTVIGMLSTITIATRMNRKNTFLGSCDQRERSYINAIIKVVYAESQGWLGIAAGG
jgi:hypothetical protein